MKLISVSICQENSVNWKKWKASKSRISGKNSGSRCSRQAFENRSAKRATALDSSFVKRRAKQAIGILQDICGSEEVEVTSAKIGEGGHRGWTELTAAESLQNGLAGVTMS
ncbi:hypothetical protein HZH68_011558 [Vespula germanica]|uniref:Uncharacterized protein n=2 Tax=Vespula TaxID=7451 RepID=A0A834N159_VESGE|nr:hypothetical protein HZH66_010240 [Vespula vulgaris]KAF7392015.1 hypothetical protein HZH68_011558 [Vespula germanica]